MVKLIDQDKDVLIFAGHVVSADDEVPGDTFQVKMAKSTVNNVHRKFADFFDYVSTPHFKEEVYQAIANAGGNISDIDRMLGNTQFRVIPQGDADLAIDALTGLRLVSLGYEVSIDRGESPKNLVYFGAYEDPADVCPAHQVFAAVLQSDKTDEDFPTAVRRLSIELGYRSDIAIKKCLENLDEMLSRNLARWENLTDPVVLPFQPTDSAVSSFSDTYKERSPFTRLKTLLRIG